MMLIQCSPKAVLKALFFVIGLLVGISSVLILVRFTLGYDNLKGLIPLFDLNTERNIPTYFSALLLLSACLLLLLIAFLRKREGQGSRAWALLGWIFLFLSVDEITSIHERFTDPVRDAFHPTGLLYYAWILPYGLIVLALAIGYLRFLLRLPRRTMKLFVLSAGLYLGGALGFEMLGGQAMEASGKETLLYAFFYTCEESLEMLGAAVFIYSLLDYLQGLGESIALRFGEPERGVAAAAPESLIESPAQR